MAEIGGVRKSDIPEDRLSYLGVEMGKPIERESNADVQAVLLLHDEADASVIVLGYEGQEEVDVLTDVLIHVTAMFEAAGMEIEFKVDGVAFGVGVDG